MPMQEKETLLDVLALIVKNRKLIFKLTVGAAILSVLIALVLPSWYSSTTTFLAASPDQSNVSKLFNNRSEVSIYGNGNDLERVLAIGMSQETVDFLIDSFNLYAVYDISIDSDNSKSKVTKEFLSHYELKRNKFDVIELSFEAKDSELAAAVANGARERISQILTGIIKRRNQELSKTYKNNFDSNTGLIKTYFDSLLSIKNKYNIVAIESQQEVLVQQLSSAKQEIQSDSAALIFYKKKGKSSKIRDSILVTSARLSSNLAGLKSIESSIDKFNQGKNTVLSLEEKINKLESDNRLYSTSITQLAAVNNQSNSTLHLIDPARVAAKKSRPVRWQIVVISTLFAFVASILWVIGYNTFKKVNWKAYLNP